MANNIVKQDPWTGKADFSNFFSKKTIFNIVLFCVLLFLFLKYLLPEIRKVIPAKKA